MNIGHTSEIRRSRRLTIKIIVTPILNPALHTCMGRRAEKGMGRSPKLRVFCVLFRYDCVLNSHFLDRLLPLLRRVLSRVGQHGGAGKRGDFGGASSELLYPRRLKPANGLVATYIPGNRLLVVVVVVVLLLFTCIKARVGRGRKL